MILNMEGNPKLSSELSSQDGDALRLPLARVDELHIVFLTKVILMSTVLWFPVAALNSALRACERRP